MLRREARRAGRINLGDVVDGNIGDARDARHRHCVLLELGHQESGIGTLAHGVEMYRYDWCWSCNA